MSIVFVKDNQVVTDSLTIARSFDKEHARVMRDIRELECSEEFRVGNFAESTYINEQQREYPKYIISEQGFTFLVMGYTGSDAMRFKESYIKEFHSMKEKIRNNVQVLDEKQSLIESMKLTIATSERQDKTEKKLIALESKVDEQITLDYGEQRSLQKAVAKRVYHFTEDKQEASKLFRQAYREIKDRFAVASYKDVKRKDLEAATNYINNWIPKRVA
ncbi:Rha family transcriptional regulator [Geomicrobium sp. JCM 19038]|uniref:Rha family transcriptional regulator n=1 Tax=Geomicrobium sp. JCM 19038 TaxID=1460635 RepID=UPI00045F1C6A|nr:Rha family transcriptional regulator [Geomicrobium sp. JCM 19038]GAK09599.1 Rha protein [Geomicrobium sp. JCM 19038]